MFTCKFDHQFDTEPTEKDKSLITFNICDVDFPKLHDHTYWEVVIMLDGEIVNHFRGKHYLLKAGDIFILRPDDVHSLTYTEKAKALYVNMVVDKSIMEKLLSCSGIDDEFIESSKPIFFDVPPAILQEINISISYLQKEIFVKQRDLRKYSILLNLVNLLQKELLQQQISPSSVNADILTKINALLMEEQNIQSINVNTLARQIGVNRVTLNRIVKNNLGLTAHELIVKFKLNYARQLLYTTSLSVTSISSQSGFFSVSSFIKTFSAHYGVTPAKYRAKYA